MQSVKPTFEDSISYDPETGLLAWKIRPDSHFENMRLARGWNGRYGGKPAGSLDSKGYIVINFNGQLQRGHRVAWFLMTGAWPVDQLDHINGDRTDNRWTNLREATMRQNSCNKKTRCDNASGHKGIRQHSKTKRWRAVICINSIQTHIGYFKTLNEAIAARKAAEQIHHGEFALSNRN